MPYCDACDRFYNPNTLDPVGDCPQGHHVADPAPADVPPPVPWHFKVMVALLVVYLGWRFVQLIDRFVF